MINMECQVSVKNAAHKTVLKVVYYSSRVTCPNRMVMCLLPHCAPMVQITCLRLGTLHPI